LHFRTRIGQQRKQHVYVAYQFIQLSQSAH
jgi:hypothetical protein